MTYTEAFEKSPLIRLPEWTGYWIQHPSGEIKAHTRTGDWVDAQVEKFGHRTDWQAADPLFGFDYAVLCLKAGKKVRRVNWNLNEYLWLLPEARVPAEWCKEPHLKELAENNPDGSKTMHCLPSIRMKTHDGKVLTGWVASQVDILSDDWQVVVE